MCFAVIGLSRNVVAAAERGACAFNHNERNLIVRLRFLQRMNGLIAQPAVHGVMHLRAIERDKSHALIHPIKYFLILSHATFSNLSEPAHRSEQEYTSLAP